MKLLPTFKMQFKSSIKSLYIFVGCIIAIILLFGVGLQLLVSDASFEYNFSFENAYSIFIFVSGLAYYRIFLHFSFATSVSRKTTFISMILNIILSSAILCVLNSVYLFIISLIEKNVQLFFSDIYNVNITNLFLAFLYNLVFPLIVCASLGCIGLFISSLFYRLNKFGKIALAAGIPCFLVIVLPMLVILLTESNSEIAVVLLNFIQKAFSLTTGISATGANPINLICTLTIAGAVFAAIGFFVCKKTQLKTK